MAPSATRRTWPGEADRGGPEALRAGDGPRALHPQRVFGRFADRDLIPQVAEFLLTEENVHTAIVYGVVVKEDDREFVVGSLRTNELTLSPDEFLKDALRADVQGRFYGGGRRDAGGFEIPVGFLSGSASLDDDIGKLKWQLIDATVSAKILEKIQRQT